MGKILNFYKKMSVEDAICVFCLLGFALMIFAIAGIFGRFLAEWISVWLFFSGVVVSAVAVIILFGKNDCFIHDISIRQQLKGNGTANHRSITNILWNIQIFT